MHQPPRSRSIALALVAPLTFGCGGTALHTDDGARYVGDVRSATAAAVVLVDGQRTAAPAGARPEPFVEATIDRARIVDVDHPGDALMVIGGALVAVGGALVVSGALHAPSPAEPDDCPERDGWSDCGGFDLDLGGVARLSAGLVLGLTGLGLGIGGLVQYQSSKGALSVGVAPGAVSLGGRF